MTRSTATANNAHAAISVVIKMLMKRLLAEGKSKKAKGKSEERPRAPAAFDLSPPPPTTFNPPPFFCLLLLSSSGARRAARAARHAPDEEARGGVDDEGDEEEHKP